MAYIEQLNKELKNMLDIKVTEYELKRMIYRSVSQNLFPNFGHLRYKVFLNDELFISLNDIIFEEIIKMFNDNTFNKKKREKYSIFVFPNFDIILNNSVSKRLEKSSYSRSLNYSRKTKRSKILENKNTVRNSQNNNEKLFNPQKINEKTLFRICENIKRKLYQKYANDNETLIVISYGQLYRLLFSFLEDYPNILENEVKDFKKYISHLDKESQGEGLRNTTFDINRVKTNFRINSIFDLMNIIQNESLKTNNVEGTKYVVDKKVKIPPIVFRKDIIKYLVENQPYLLNDGKYYVEVTQKEMEYALSKYLDIKIIKSDLANHLCKSFRTNENNKTHSEDLTIIDEIYYVFLHKLYEYINEIKQNIPKNEDTIKNILIPISLELKEIYDKKKA